MQEHSGNEKSIVWSAVDFADEEQRTEMFCARFASQEREFAAQHVFGTVHSPCAKNSFHISYGACGKMTSLIVLLPHCVLL